MKNIKTMITCAAVFTATLLAVEGRCDLTREQRISDAQTMIALFEHRYAPIEWKKEYLDISFDDLAAELMGAVYREDMTDIEFYGAMAHMSAGVQDTHNWFIIPSSYESKLGFITDYVEGKVLIHSVDRNALPSNIFPFERGDELVSIDGKPVMAIMDEFSYFYTRSNELFNLRARAHALTSIEQMFYPEIPSGEAKLEIYSRERSSTEEIIIPWITTGVPLAEVNVGGGEQSLSKSEMTSHNTDKIVSGKTQESALERLRLSELNEKLAENSELGIPKPSFVLWDTFVKRHEFPLYTGIFLLDGKRIGFIRINRWRTLLLNLFVTFVEKEISFMQRQTDALVIDETDNPGGISIMPEIFSSFLVSKPIPAVLFEIRANRHFLQNYEDTLKQCSSEEECELISRIVEEMRRSIANGDLLTPPLPLGSLDGLIHPHKTSDGTKIIYTKPVLMLVNERSVSAADIAPAILQDAGRAVIFGSRTCGAGGSVKTTDRIGYSDFRISQTESLAWRPKPVMSPNGIMTQYIENVGVIPDVEYDVTIEDFIGGYEGYKTAINATLKEMLNSN